MSRAECPQQCCPAVRRSVMAGWELCPHPLPHTSLTQKHLKHNSLVYDPCVAHLILPEKGKTHILPAPTCVFNAGKSQYLQPLYW